MWKLMHTPSVRLGAFLLGLVLGGGAWAQAPASRVPGTNLWSFAIKVPFTTAPSLAAEGTLFAGTFEDALLARG